MNNSSLRCLFQVVFGLLVVYWVLLFLATHQPVSTPDLFEHFDKLLHFTAYAGLAFLLTLLFGLSTGFAPRIGIWVWTICVVYGALDEYSQKFVPDRAPEKLDLLADVLGAAVGIGIAYVSVSLWRILRSPLPLPTQNPVSDLGRS